MSSITTVDYEIRKGETWDRLIMPLDRRTRKRLFPTRARAGMRLEGGSTVLPINADISNEGGVWLSLDEDETAALDAGVYEFDVWATVPEYPLVSSEYEDKPIARGTITVTAYDEIAPEYA